MSDDIDDQLKAIASRWKARQNLDGQHDVEAEGKERARIAADPKLLEEAVREYQGTLQDGKKRLSSF